MTVVGILGAGLSGLAMGMALRRRGIDDFTIYERFSDVGGTWHRNTYPGLHCDIPSHLYSYSFEPNPDWSMIYSGQAEIQRYLRSCAEKYGLIDHIRFETSVETARYDEDRGRWVLEIAGEPDATHRMLVSATGGLTAPRFPRIEGLDTFEGPMWHSAAWRHDVDLTGERVAVVGSAASAVQVVPEVAKLAAEVVVFSRTPNWVTPRNNRFYTDAEKQAFRDPQVVSHHRQDLYRDSLTWFKAFRRRPDGIDTLRDRVLSQMRAAIDDPELIAALTPDYDPGCNRILVSDDYYPTLAMPHVRLVPQGVTALSPTGVVAADGTEHTVDVVIFCTGYRLGGRDDGRPAVVVFGRDGVELRDALGDRPQAYRGVAIPGFPNYFTLTGINGAVSYAAVFASSELHAELVARFADRLLAEDLKSIEARPDTTEAYNDAIQEELSTMSWTGDCSNFYRDRHGRVVTFHPGTVGRLRRELAACDLDEFDVASFA